MAVETHLPRAMHPKSLGQCDGLALMQRKKNGIKILARADRDGASGHVSLRNLKSGWLTTDMGELTYGIFKFPISCFLG